MLVSGGGSGIGKTIVRGFTRQKCKVAFIDIARGASEFLAAELSANGHEVHFEYADLRDITALRAPISRVKDRFGPAQVLVNNAAHDERHVTADVTQEYWDDRISANPKHQFFASQAVLPGMRASGSGVIINVGSISWMIGQGGMAAYTASTP